MRNRASATGRLLRSVALRYRLPCGRFAEQLPSICRYVTNSGGKKEAEPIQSGGASPRDERLGQLEAILFLSSQPVGSRKLAQLADLADGTKARTLVRKLNRLYDAEGRAFRVEEVAGGFQLLTRSKFAPWLRRLHTAPVEIRLSGPAMETLAVVAYRQPVLRADIEAIRGVQSGEVLRQLIERDMVRIVGRSEELGRPFLYGTGKRFLQVFGLRHLDELPQIALIQSGGQAVSATASPAEAATEIQKPDTTLPQAATDIPKTLKEFPEGEEEKNVKTFTTTKARPEFVAEEPTAALMEPERRRLADRKQKGLTNHVDDDDDYEDEDDDEDFEDEEFDDLDDDEDEEEEEEDEELEDEWEEVEDDEEEEEEDEDDEDWDDEDWDDDDWDEDEDEFDDDEDEDEEDDDEE